MRVLQLLMYILLSTLLTDFHASADTPSWRDRADLLQFHTRIRENVQPPASYMRLMVCHSSTSPTLSEGLLVSDATISQ